jgi:hypothetical protein
MRNTDDLLEAIEHSPDVYEGALGNQPHLPDTFSKRDQVHPKDSRDTTNAHHNNVSFVGTVLVDREKTSHAKDSPQLQANTPKVTRNYVKTLVAEVYSAHAPADPVALPQNTIKGAKAVPEGVQRTRVADKAKMFESLAAKQEQPLKKEKPQTTKEFRHENRAHSSSNAAQVPEQQSLTTQTPSFAPIPPQKPASISPSKEVERISVNTSLPSQSYLSPKNESISADSARKRSATEKKESSGSKSNLFARLTSTLSAKSLLPNEEEENRARSKSSFTNMSPLNTDSANGSQYIKELESFQKVLSLTSAHRKFSSKDALAYFAC